MKNLKSNHVDGAWPTGTTRQKLADLQGLKCLMIDIDSQADCSSFLQVDSKQASGNDLDAPSEREFHDLPEEIKLDYELSGLLDKSNQIK